MYLEIYDVGNIPFELVYRILLNMAPQQLLVIESKSPQIKPKTNGIWKIIVEREFPPAVIQLCLDRLKKRAMSSPMSRSELHKSQRIEEMNSKQLLAENNPESYPKFLNSSDSNNNEYLINYRDLYAELTQDLNQKLESASARLRSSMKQAASERQSNSIVQLEKDPQVSKYYSTRKSASAPVGSRILQKSMRDTFHRSSAISRKVIGKKTSISRYQAVFGRSIGNLENVKLGVNGKISHDSNNSSVNLPKANHIHPATTSLNQNRPHPEGSITKRIFKLGSANNYSKPTSLENEHMKKPFQIMSDSSTTNNSDWLKNHPASDGEKPPIKANSRPASSINYSSRKVVKNTRAPNIFIKKRM